MGLRMRNSCLLNVKPILLFGRTTHLFFFFFVKYECHICMLSSVFVVLVAIGSSAFFRIWFDFSTVLMLSNWILQLANIQLKSPRYRCFNVMLSTKCASKSISSLSIPLSPFIIFFFVIVVVFLHQFPLSHSLRSDWFWPFSLCVPFYPFLKSKTKTV